MVISFYNFNIHIDDNLVNNAKELVISKGLDISSVMVKDHSDHSCVFFDLLITLWVQISAVSVKRNYINESSSAQFMEAIAMSLTMSAETVDVFLITSI